MPFDAPSRQAALLLHALGSADREWVLNSLPALQRDELRGLLQELQDLGIPADRHFLDQLALQAVAANSTRDGNHAAQKGEASLGGMGCSFDNFVNSMESLQPRQIEKLADLLGREPAGLVARLLNMKDWSWHEALLSRLDLNQRSQIRETLSGLRSRESNVSTGPVQGVGASSVRSPSALERALAAVLIGTFEPSAGRTDPVQPEGRSGLRASASELWSHLRVRVRVWPRTVL